MPSPLLSGKRGLIMGVANQNSIAWGMARVITALYVCLMMAGCTASIKEFSEESDVGRSFDVSDNYENVYKNIKQYALKCWSASGIGFQFRVHYDLLSVKKAAEITWISESMSGNIIYIHVNITSVGNGTNVKIQKNKIIFTDRIPDRIEDAARNGSEAC